MVMNDFEHFISSSSWRFAKTMPLIPHEYTLRKNAGSEEAFEAAVTFIRENGYTEYFGRNSYRYLNVDGWRYWSMGYPVNETTVINRARVEESRTPPERF